MTAVLFTCAGQRVDIVSAFARAGATTIATDLDPLAPALYHADFRVPAPPIDDPGYVDAISALVAEHDVQLIVPLTDLDHVPLAHARERLDALVLLPSEDVVRCVGDKYLAHVFFEQQGIPTPPGWLPEHVPAGASQSASTAIVVAPARAKAETMSTRWPAHVKRTVRTRGRG